MIWTDQVLKEAEKLSATMTLSEIAAKYNVTPDTMRKALSNYGISSLSRRKEEEDRKTAAVLYARGLSVYEIMERLGRCYKFVDAAARNGRPKLDRRSLKIDRNRARKLFAQGLSVKEIVERIKRCVPFVKNALGHQLSMWNRLWWRRKAKKPVPTMQIVHVRSHNAMPVQLSLFDQPLALAA